MRDAAFIRVPSPAAASSSNRNAATIAGRGTPAATATAAAAAQTNLAAGVVETTADALGIADPVVCVSAKKAVLPGETYAAAVLAEQIAAEV